MRYAKYLAALCAAGGLLFAATGVRATPTNGWWWNPAQSGRGFAIEVQGATFFLSTYLYEANGRATWYASSGQSLANWAYQGTLQAYGNGQTLTGSYKPNVMTNANVGSISLQFSDATHGTLTWPGGTIPIERYIFGSGTPAFKPDTGWWWNPAESGRGFFIEVQGNALFIAGYMYDSAGNPIWYAASGSMTSGTLFQGHWDQFSGGQTLTGSYKAPTLPPGNAGTLTLQFTSSTAATLTLPNARQISLTRFYFAPDGSDYTRVSAPGVITGNSEDQAKFIATRGYPHIFTLGFVTEDLGSNGVAAALLSPRRVETWGYNGTKFTSALFDNGYFISERTWGDHANIQSTNLKPYQFTLGMTEAQVTALMGPASCIETLRIAGKSVRYLRYNPSTSSPAATVTIENGTLGAVTAGYAMVDSTQTTSSLCTAGSRDLGRIQ